MNLPEPLVPSEVDLTDFPSAYVRVDSITEGYLSRIYDDDAFRIAILLMLASWHEVPAASLPNDDRALAELAGVCTKKLRRLKVKALAGFELCPDGRWYHRDLAERANSAWPKKVKMRRRIDRRLQIESGEWAAIRFSIFARDDFTCQYCGARNVRLECDHVVPWSKGGLSVEDNLATACKDCNRSKGAKTLEEWKRPQ